MFLYNILLLLILIVSTTCLSKTIDRISTKELKKLNNLLVHGHELSKTNQFRDAIKYYECSLQVLEGRSEPIYSKLRVLCALKLARCLTKVNHLHKAVARCDEVIDECSNLFIEKQQQKQLPEDAPTNMTKAPMIVQYIGNALLIRGIVKSKLLPIDEKPIVPILDVLKSLECEQPVTDKKDSIVKYENIGYSSLDIAEEEEEEEEDAVIPNTQRRVFSAKEVNSLAAIPTKSNTNLFTNQGKKSPMFSLRGVLQGLNGFLGGEKKLLQQLTNTVTAFEFVQTKNTLIDQTLKRYFPFITLLLSVLWIGFIFI